MIESVDTLGWIIIGALGAWFVVMATAVALHLDRKVWRLRERMWDLRSEVSDLRSEVRAAQRETARLTAAHDGQQRRRAA